MTIDIALFKTDLNRDEGNRLKPYTDTKGNITIGVGHNLTANGISPAVRDFILTEDINDAIASLDMAFPVWSGLSEPRQRALANMVFTLGLTRFLEFKDMLACIRNGDFMGAAAAALDSPWAKIEAPSRAARIATLLENG